MCHLSLVHEGAGFTPLARADWAAACIKLTGPAEAGGATAEQLARFRLRPLDAWRLSRHAEACPGRPATVVALAAGSLDELLQRADLLDYKPTLDGAGLRLADAPFLTAADLGKKLPLPCIVHCLHA